jgi:hypothetical protein
MCPYRRNNNGYNWILICIDVFSKFVWIKLLKTKAAKDYVESKILIYTMLRAIKMQVLLKEF